MSDSNPVSEGETASAPLAPPDPRKNPAYPQRVHLHEKPHWQSVLRDCEARLANARQRLRVVGNDPKRAGFERIFAQMTGARDQIADAVGRLPQETGDLYEEDKHRAEAAVAALDRLFARWESQTLA